MNQSELVEAARVHLQAARTTLATGRQTDLAERIRQVADLLAAQTPATYAAREAVVAILRELPDSTEHPDSRTALRAAEQSLTAALSAQHRAEG